MLLCLNRRRERLIQNELDKPHSALHYCRQNYCIAPVAPTTLGLCLLLDLRDELIDRLLDRRDALA